MHPPSIASFEPVGQRFQNVLRQDGGGALIETALVIPILFFMLLGAMEFGMVEYASIEVENAARAGAQYGAQGSGYSIDTVGIQNAAAADDPNVTASSSFTTICSDDTSPTGVPLTCANGGPVEVILTVTTRASFAPLIKIPEITPASFTLTGSAVEKVSE